MILDLTFLLQAVIDRKISIFPVMVQATRPTSRVKVESYRSS
jgi:hypothetical protein